MKIILLILFIIANILNVVFAAEVEVKDLVDVNGSYNPGVNCGDMVLGFNLQIAGISSPAPSDTFKIKFTSANGSGSRFRVKRTLSNSYIRYRVRFYSEPDATGTMYTMSSDVDSSTIILKVKGWQFEPFSLRIVFLEANLKSAIVGTYIDTLTVLVTGI